MNKNRIQIKAAFRLIKAVSAVFVLAVSGTCNAEENCNSWGAAGVDATKGRYAIELRTCDLTYGLSAYVEIRNMTDARLALAYRIITGDDKYKDGEIVLEPGAITRAGNCQACAKRHAGFKSWEIVSAEEAPADSEAAQQGAAKPAALPAFMDKPAAAQKSVVVPPAKPAIVILPSGSVPPKPAADAAPLVAPAPVAVPAPTAVVPATAAPTKTEAEKPAPATEPGKKDEGFRADDGTIIPWDQMPPEFRPRK